MRRATKLVAYALLGMIGLLSIVVVAVLLTSPAAPALPDAPPAPRRLSNQRATFTLDISPDTAFADVPVNIVISGLEPDDDVVVRGETEDEDGRLFTSWARFQANANGVVDLAVETPLEGTYRSANSSGLVWSMRSASGEWFRSSNSWTQRTYRISAETRDGIVESEITRTYPWRSVTRETVSVGDVTAELWLPASDASVPVIIWLGGSGGSPSRTRASFMAGRGFAVLDLMYLGGGDVPELVGIPLERVTLAIDFASSHARIDGRRTGLFGTSKGAELALEVAVHDPRVRAVATWAPSSVAFEGISFRKLRPGSSWSWNGTPVNYARYPLTLRALANPIRMIFGKPMHFRPIYEQTLARAPDEAFIPVEQIAGRILLLSGTDAQMWPSSHMAAQIVARLERHGRLQDVRNRVYHGAGHGMAFELWPQDREPEDRVLHGGSPEADRRAGQAAWGEIITFFQTELGLPAGDNEGPNDS